jgi:hypothetical protein
MGLVHTGIHSKLGVEKVRKTTIVGMDIKCAHLEAGLLPTQGQRNFTSGSEAAGTQVLLNDISSIADHLDIGNDNNDLMDFNQFSESLIAGAASANFDKDMGDDNDLDDATDELPSAINMPAQSGPLTITIPP